MEQLLDDSGSGLRLFAIFGHPFPRHSGGSVRRARLKLLALLDASGKSEAFKSDRSTSVGSQVTGSGDFGVSLLVETHLRSHFPKLVLLSKEAFLLQGIGGCRRILRDRSTKQVRLCNSSLFASLECNLGKAHHPTQP